jgi:hypothetical protein
MSSITRYSVHIYKEHWYEVHGLGLPFERLYFCFDSKANTATRQDRRASLGIHGPYRTA